MKNKQWTEEKIKDEKKKCIESPYYFFKNYVEILDNKVFNIHYNENDFNKIFTSLTTGEYYKNALKYKFSRK